MFLPIQNSSKHYLVFRSRSLCRVFEVALYWWLSLLGTKSSGTISSQQLVSDFGIFLTQGPGTTSLTRARYLLLPSDCDGTSTALCPHDFPLHILFPFTPFEELNLPVKMSMSCSCVRGAFSIRQGGFVSRVDDTPRQGHP